jgi:DNA-binding NarL/FixJ family response regulator
LHNTPAKNKPGAISILIAESQRIYIAGLRSVFAKNSDCVIIGVVDTFEAMRQWVIDKHPSVVLLDETLIARRPDQLQWLAATHPSTRIVIAVNSEEREFNLSLLHSGACAVIPRVVAPPEMVKRIRSVARGNYSISSTVQAWLIDDWRRSRKALGVCTLPVFSKRENTIVRMVLGGHKNSDIAVELGTTEQTIKNNLNRLYKKLQVNNRMAFQTLCKSLGVTVAPAVPEAHRQSRERQPAASA